MRIKIFHGFPVFCELTPGKLYRIFRTGDTARDQLPVYSTKRLEYIDFPPGTLFVFLYEDEGSCGKEERWDDVPPNVFLFEDLEVSMGAYLGSIGWALEEVDTDVD